MPDSSKQKLAAVEELVGWSGQAYRLAVSALGGAEGAEDVVQDAYLEALGKLRPGESGAARRSWFMTVVVARARDRRKAELRRRKRETAVVVPAETEDRGMGVDGEMIRALSAALYALEPEDRLPLTLCYQEGMSQDEAAAVLQVSQRTVSERVRAALEKLRRAMVQAGYPAALAAILDGLKGTAPAVPSGLSGSVEKLLRCKAPSAGSLGGAAAKGGLIMKIGLGIAAVSLVAGTTFWAAGGNAADTPAAPPPAAEPKPKFDIPIWHPDVRWSTDKECIGGSGLLGHLQGPQREIMRYSEPSFSPLFGPDAGNQPAIYSHDAKIERVHIVAGGSAGYLDGPFSRARFGGWSYGARSTGARSPNGRFVYFTEPYYDKVLRQLDLKEQRASTVSLPKGTVISLASDDEGNLYTLMDGGTLLILDAAQGKVTRTIKLDPGTESIGYALSWSTTLDTVNNRLYATKFGAKSWYIWYWDIKDGSFHGVLAIPQEGEPVRPKPPDGGIGGCLPGPFKGTKLYNEGSVYFGPDDPQRRFLYTSRVDTPTFFRLDLEKQELWVFAIDKDKKVFRFIGPGETGALGTGVDGLNVLPDGGFMSTSPHWTGAQVFVNKRLK